MFPDVRLRRLRKSGPIRDLVAEYMIEVKDLIQPFLLLKVKIRPSQSIQCLA